MDLLTNVIWTFDETEYESIEDFKTKFSRQQTDKGNTNWNPDEIIIADSKFDVVFSAWIEEDDLLQNEIILEDDNFFDDKSKSEFGLFLADIQAELTADNGKNFTAMEVMYKIDLQMKEKELGDDSVFESLGSLESDSETLKYYLFLKS